MKKIGAVAISTIIAVALLTACSSGPHKAVKESEAAQASAASARESINADHYAKAEDLAVKGNYAEAIEEYKQAEDYSDAKDKIFAIYHSQAEKALADDKYDEAIDYFQKASLYKDIGDEILSVYYKQGERAFVAGEYDKAISFFKFAGTYKDSSARLSEIAYAQAEQALKNKDNVAAARYYADAGNYKDASDQAKKLYYNLGTASLKNKKYDDALEYFSNAGDYNDSKNQIKGIYFIKGKDLISKKQYEQGASALKSAGNYAGAAKLLDTTITALITSKDYDNAEKVAAYCDAANVTGLKNYIAGRRAYNSGDYANAILAFEKAGGIRDSALFIKASNYSLGLKALNEKDYKSAQSYFEKGGTYKNSKVLFYVCAGETAFADKRYDTAASYYSKVPKTFKVNGINIASRKVVMSRISAFAKVKGRYSVQSNDIRTTHYSKRNKKRKYYWYVIGTVNQQYLNLDYSVNRDGTINLVGTVYYHRYTNYSNLRDQLNRKFERVTFSLNNLKSIPSNAVIGNHLRLKYKKGKFTVVYSEKDNYSMFYYNVYKSTVNFKKG